MSGRGWHVGGRISVEDATDLLFPPVTQQECDEIAAFRAKVAAMTPEQRAMVEKHQRELHHAFLFGGPRNG